MSETKPKPVDFSNAKEPPNSLDSAVDTTAENANLDPKFDFYKQQDAPDKQKGTISPGERMIQETWMRGGR
ncbi:hypothetical protein NG796_01210 [Laspinema sp. A4]|uniref:hypothetical protein n=1 Tax=Laspinema sp. D2d TaxID=2953686 RepID=UPI0021BA51E1|nr:hypothetical protein [Laspinema sp. D2d]MCT7981905.1 hypothetical protein [Laspinema sp. D2d]